MSISLLHQDVPMQAAEAAKDAGRQDAVHEVIVPFIF